jgi:hypothetical protein
MNESPSEKKPGLGSALEPVALVVLAVLFGTCSGYFAGGRMGSLSSESPEEAGDPAKEGRKKALEATTESEPRLDKAYRAGFEKGKEKKIREFEEELARLMLDDKEIWNTTIEKNAIDSCTSYYMKGINEGEKSYESAFRWEYQVPTCREGMISTKLSERLQLYHGQIPVGDGYERDISEELWGDCEKMSKHYVEVLKNMKQLNLNQQVEWKVEKKEVSVTKD